MKIVIEISEEVYDSIKSNEEIITYVTKDGGGSKALHGSLAIINGTILPKGHGRLIDANNITFSEFFDAGDYAQAMRGIYNAPTIIEADKEII